MNKDKSPDIPSGLHTLQQGSRLLITLTKQETEQVA